MAAHRTTPVAVGSILETVGTPQNLAPDRSSTDCALPNLGFRALWSSRQSPPARQRTPRSWRSDGCIGSTPLTSVVGEARVDGSGDAIPGVTGTIYSRLIPDPSSLGSTPNRVSHVTRARDIRRQWSSRHRHGRGRCDEPISSATPALCAWPHRAEAASAEAASAEAAHADAPTRCQGHAWRAESNSPRGLRTARPLRM